MFTAQFSILLLASALLTAEVIAAQQFEAASIRLNKSGAYESAIRREGGQIVFDNVPLRECIAYSFGIRPDNEYALSGPAWLAADRYDIAARVSPDVPRDQVRAMVQALLQDRFALRTHRENRKLRIYSLVIARGGSKLKPPSRTDGSFTFRPGHTSGEGLSMAELAARLSGPTFKLGLPVVNQTGLAGDFDFALDWAPDETVSDRGSDPSMFTALQEQLGLKLVATRAPVEILIVDHITRTVKAN